MTSEFPPNWRSSPAGRLESEVEQRLQKRGCKPVKKDGGYGILVFNLAAMDWDDGEGMFPEPYSLTLSKAADLANQYEADAAEDPEIDHLVRETMGSIDGKARLP